MSALSKPTAAVCRFCGVSPLAREASAYFSHTFTERKQMRGRSEILKASEEDSFVHAGNLLCGSGNLIP